MKNPILFSVLVWLALAAVVGLASCTRPRIAAAGPKLRAEQALNRPDFQHKVPEIATATLLKTSSDTPRFTSNKPATRPTFAAAGNKIKYNIYSNKILAGGAEILKAPAARADQYPPPPLRKLRPPSGTFVIGIGTIVAGLISLAVVARDGFLVVPLLFFLVGSIISLVGAIILLKWLLNNWHSGRTGMDSDSRVGLLLLLLGAILLFTGALGFPLVYIVGYEVLSYIFGVALFLGAILFALGIIIYFLGKIADFG